ncbi:hypothetical protein ACFFHT_02475 [Gallibacterium melopsittaci]|uniref:Antitoxin n=1 Tax=Gallibacterium melopsittaci TaxID=516063 RepID=A0ABV6HWF2_9PAST
MTKNTVRINFDTDFETKQKIKIYTSAHNLTMREFFEELIEEKFNSDVQSLTEEEQKEIDEAFEFFKDKKKYNFSSSELNNIANRVRNNNEDLATLLNMNEFIND